MAGARATASRNARLNGRFAVERIANGMPSGWVPDRQPACDPGRPIELSRADEAAAQPQARRPQSLPARHRDAESRRPREPPAASDGRSRRRHHPGPARTSRQPTPVPAQGEPIAEACSAAPSPERRSAACRTPAALLSRKRRLPRSRGAHTRGREIASAHGRCSRRSRRVLRPLRRAAKRCRSGSANPRRV